MVAILFELLQKNGSDISICNFVPFTQNITTSNKTPVIETISGKEAALRLYQKEYTTQAVVAWDKLYKKSVFKNLRFKVGKFNEDEFFSYKALLNAPKVTFTSQELYYYFIRDTGISKAITNPKSLDGLDAKIEAIDYYRKNNQLEILKAAVLSFLYFTAKRYCFVSRKRHSKVYKENSSLLPLSQKWRAASFQFFPLSFWFFLKYDKFKQKMQK